MKHASKNNILYELQHRFREQRSCETQLLEFRNDLLQNMKDAKQSVVFIVDFSKAFDKMGHKRLMEKLSYYGISGSTNRWIKNFISNRDQTVVIEGLKSYVTSVTSGVPRGSILGPCLFLLYINDLPEALNSRVRLFADDTIAYLTVTSERDAQELQKDFDKMGKWEEDWQM